MMACNSFILCAQTAGTLTFTFSEVSKTPTYNGNSQHVLAAWVQTSAGAFVKTKLRYAGGGTSDHLPTWSVNAGGTAGNCLSAAANVVDATTGATRSSWTTYSVVWNGESGPAASGTVQPDGTYKFSIQSTWNHGTGGTSTTYYTFTKGPTSFQQTISADPNYGNILIDWEPTVVTGLTSSSFIPEISVFPNPTTGVFNIDYSNTNNIKVFNTLGEIVFNENVTENSSGNKSINLANFANGIYMIKLSNAISIKNYKVILSK